MPQQLPLVPSLPNYRFTTTLDGTSFVFDVRWNARDEAWYMDISDALASPIALGMKVVLGTLLGSRVSDARFPAGIFFAADLSNQGLDAGFDDLGARVVVQYISNTELAELGL